MNYTQNYQLNQWDATDRVLRTDFNSDNQKIDAALKNAADAVAAEAAARAAGDVYVKLLDVTLESELQKWDVDVSAIDLAQYQKLLMYPHLKGNNDQWVYLRLNGLTSGYSSPNNATSYCGNIPMMNDTARQNFGVCEFTFLPELPNLYVVQIGVTTPTSMPGQRGYRCPPLSSGVTHLNTLNFWFDSSNYHLLPGSNVQIYGLRK